MRTSDDRTQYTSELVCQTIGAKTSKNHCLIITARNPQKRKKEVNKYVGENRCKKKAERLKGKWKDLAESIEWLTDHFCVLLITFVWVRFLVFCYFWFCFVFFFSLLFICCWWCSFYLYVFSFSFSLVDVCLVHQIVVSVFDEAVDFSRVWFRSPFAYKDFLCPSPFTDSFLLSFFYF